MNEKFPTPHLRFLKSIFSILHLIVGLIVKSDYILNVMILNSYIDFLFCAKNTQSV